MDCVLKELIHSGNLEVEFLASITSNRIDKSRRVELKMNQFEMNSSRVAGADQRATHWNSTDAPGSRRCRHPNEPNQQELIPALRFVRVNRNQHRNRNQKVEIHRTDTHTDTQTHTNTQTHTRTSKERRK